MCVNNYPKRCNNMHFIYICKLLYMFRVVFPPIIRSSYHCIYSIWTWLDGNSHSATFMTGSSNGFSNTRRSRQVAVTVSIMPDTVDTVVWAPDDGWTYHPKHVEQFADISKLYIVASFWTVIESYNHLLGTAVAQWWMCCATNRKVTGSIPDGVIGIFHWHYPSDRTMALGSTQPLTEMSTGSISWG